MFPPDPDPNPYKKTFFADMRYTYLVIQDTASEAARARREKELELEVLTGTVRGWEGESIDQVGNPGRGGKYYFLGQR